jgi:hypothetical protein
MELKTTPNKMSKAFWIYTSILIGAIGVVCIGFVVYIIYCSFSTNIESTPVCTPFTVGNWFDLFIGLVGLALAFLVTWYAKIHDLVHEKYCIALLAFISLVMYGLINYDIKSQECKNPGPWKMSYQYQSTNRQPEEKTHSQQNP